MCGIKWPTAESGNKEDLQISAALIFANPSFFQGM